MTFGKISNLTGGKLWAIDDSKVISKAFQNVISNDMLGDTQINLTPNPTHNKQNSLSYAKSDLGYQIGKIV